MQFWILFCLFAYIYNDNNNNNNNILATQDKESTETIWLSLKFNRTLCFHGDNVFAS